MFQRSLVLRSIPTNACVLSDYCRPLYDQSTGTDISESRFIRQKQMGRMLLGTENYRGQHQAGRSQACRKVAGTGLPCSWSPLIIVHTPTFLHAKCKVTNPIGRENALYRDRNSMNSRAKKMAVRAKKSPLCPSSLSPSLAVSSEAIDQSQPWRGCSRPSPLPIMIQI